MLTDEMKKVLKNSDNTTVIPFVDKTDKTKWALLVVKNQFFTEQDIAPEKVNKTNPEVIFRDKQMANYLHNQMGPSIYWNSPKKEWKVKTDWWVDGKRLDLDAAKELEKRLKFDDTLNELLAT